MELTALLITEYSTELCNTQRKILVRTRLTSVDLAVVRTVHWLEHILLILLRCLDRLECILAIVSIVTRCYIETLATDTWTDNLLIVIRLQERTEQLLQAQTKLCTLWQPDRKTLTYTLREHEEFHLLTNLTVITLLSLFENNEIFIKHLFLREADTIDTGHLLTLSITAPESTSHTCNLHSLDQTGVHQVRTTAKVGEVALGICGDRAILQVLFDVLALVFLTVSLELSECISLRNLLANYRLVLLGKFQHLSLDLGEVILRNHLTLSWHHIVEETALYGWTETKLNTRIKLLKSFSEQVCRSMPECVLTLLILKLIEFYIRILIDRTVQLYCLTIYTARYNVASESR